MVTVIKVFILTLLCSQIAICAGAGLVAFLFLLPSPSLYAHWLNFSYNIIIYSWGTATVVSFVFGMPVMLIIAPVRLRLIGMVALYSIGSAFATMLIIWLFYYPGFYQLLIGALAGACYGFIFGIAAYQLRKLRVFGPSIDAQMKVDLEEFKG